MNISLKIAVFAVLATAITAHASTIEPTKFENDVSWFDNSSRQFELWPEFVPEAYKSSAMSVTYRDDPLFRWGNTTQLTARFSGQRTRFMVWVAEGDDPAFVAMVRSRIDSLLVRLCEEGSWALPVKATMNRGRKSGRKIDPLSALFYGNLGDVRQLIRRTATSRSPFMGDTRAQVSTITIEWWRAEFMRVIGIPLEVRWRIRNYYDAESNKTVVVLFTQQGINHSDEAQQEASPNEQLRNLLYQFMMLTGCRKEEFKQAQEEMKNFEWHDIEPDFEKYFKTKKTTGGTHAGNENKNKDNDDTTDDIITFTDGHTDGGENNGGGNNHKGPEVTITNIAAPHDGGGRAIEVAEFVTKAVENNQSVFLLTLTGGVIEVEKGTGAVTLHSKDRCKAADIACMGGTGALTAYVKGTGVVDHTTGQTLWTPEEQWADFRITSNPAGGVVVWDDSWVVALDGKGEEQAAYEVPGKGFVAVTADGEIWHVTASSGMVSRFKGGEVGDAVSLGVGNATWAGVGRDGNVEICTANHGIFTIDPKAPTPTLMSDKSAEIPPMTMLVHDAQRYYALAAWPAQVHTYTPLPSPTSIHEVLTPHSPLGGITSNLEPTYIHTDSFGNLWTLSRGGAVVTREGGIAGYGTFCGIITPPKHW